MKRTQRLPDPEALSPTIRAIRPDGPRGVERQVGLNAVLGAVLGDRPKGPAVGRFELEKKVGEGGMGVVYRARDERGELAAVKLLRHAAAGAKQRFYREAEVLRAIQHPRVARYLESGTDDDGSLYIAMEWLVGHDLALELRRGPLPIEVALTAGIGAAEGLSAAHAVGVVHRDIKPSNLFLVGGRIDSLKVIDFGIAKVESADTKLTHTGAVLGTPSYMAPEQIRGSVSASTDVYGLGVTLFEMVTGRPPFVAQNPVALMLAIVAEPPPSAQALRPEIPAPLNALLRQMLAKDPADRPADMNAVLAELSDLVVDVSNRPAVPPAVSYGERPRPERTPPMVASERAPLVGRAKELGQLRGLIEDCLEEGLGNAVLLCAPSGMGTTRLLDELAEDPGVRDADVRLRVRCGEAAEVGAFRDLRRLVDAAPVIGALGAPRQKLLALIDELYVRKPTERGGDPKVMADALRVAWSELVDAWGNHGRVVLMIEDGHRADQASLRYFFRAGLRLGGGPTFSIITFQPGPILDRSRETVDARWFTQIDLGPLRPRSLRRLARFFAPDAPVHTVRALAEASLGHPGHLEHLARTVREGGHAALSLADHFYDELHRLDPENRRLVRAASIVGKVFWPSVVASLLGRDDVSTTENRIRRLAERGLFSVVEMPTIASETEYEFKSDLLRQAAWALTEPSDRIAAHRIVADWLRDRQSVGPAAIAGHYLEAGAHDEAAPYWMAAVRAAVAAEDARQVDALLERGERLRAVASVEGALALYRAQVAVVRGDLAAARCAAEDARAKLPEGAAEWYEAAAIAWHGSAHLAAERTPQLETIVRCEPADAPAADAKAVSLGRLLPDLRVEELRLVVPAVLELDERVSTARAKAWVARARYQEHHDGFEDSRRALFAAYGWHSEVGDLRAAAEVQVALAASFLQSGQWEHAGDALGAAERTALHLQSDPLLVSIALLRGQLLVETGPPHEARAALLALLHGGPRDAEIAAASHLSSALLALKLGAPQEALGACDGASACGEGLRCSGQIAATRVLAWCELGDAARVTKLIEQLDQREPVVPLPPGRPPYGYVPTIPDALRRVAQVRAFELLGRDDEARDVASRARGELAQAADSLRDDWLRAQCLHRPFVHARLYPINEG